MLRRSFEFRVGSPPSDAEGPECKVMLDDYNEQCQGFVDTDACRTRTWKMNMKFEVSLACPYRLSKVGKVVKGSTLHTLSFRSLHKLLYRDKLIAKLLLNEVKHCVENLKIGLTSTTLKCLEKLYSQTSEYNLFSIVSIGLGIRSSISHSVSVCCLERGRSFLLSRKLRHRFARIRRFLLRVIVLRSGFLGGGR